MLYRNARKNLWNLCFHFIALAAKKASHNALETLYCTIAFTISTSLSSSLDVMVGYGYVWSTLVFKIENRNNALLETRPN